MRAPADGMKVCKICDFDQGLLIPVSGKWEDRRPVCERCFRAGLHLGEADGMFRERLAALTDPDADGGGYPIAEAAEVAQRWVEHELAYEAAKVARGRYEESYLDMRAAGRAETPQPADLTEVTLAATVARVRMDELKKMVVDMFERAIAAADERGGPPLEEQIAERALRDEPISDLFAHPGQDPRYDETGL